MNEVEASKKPTQKLTRYTWTGCIDNEGTMLILHDSTTVRSVDGNVCSELCIMTGKDFKTERVIQIGELVPDEILEVSFSEN